MDGSDRRLLLTKVGHAYGVAVVKGVVYWSDWQTESVWRADVSDNGSLSTGRGVERHLVTAGVTGLMDVHAASLMTSHHSHCESESLRSLMLYSHIHTLV